jgi:hypothetical protein
MQPPTHKGHPCVGCYSKKSTAPHARHRNTFRKAAETEFQIWQDAVWQDPESSNGSLAEHTRRD